MNLVIVSRPIRVTQDSLRTAKDLRMKSLRGVADPSTAIRRPLRTTS